MNLLLFLSKDDDASMEIDLVKLIFRVKFMVDINKVKTKLK